MRYKTGHCNCWLIIVIYPLLELCLYIFALIVIIGLLLINISGKIKLNSGIFSLYCIFLLWIKKIIRKCWKICVKERPVQLKVDSSCAA